MNNNYIGVNKIRKPINNNEGLTLVEVLAVMVILAVIMAIAIPSIYNIIQNQEDKAVLSDISIMLKNARLKHTNEPCENSICIFNGLNSDFEFYSNRFSSGEIDFSNGNKQEEVFIRVDFDTSKFKGTYKEFYKQLLNNSIGFTEKQLLDALNR